MLFSCKLVVLNIYPAKNANSIQDECVYVYVYVTERFVLIFYKDNINIEFRETHFLVPIST